MREREAPGQIIPTNQENEKSHPVVVDKITPTRAARWLNQYTMLQYPRQRTHSESARSNGTAHDAKIHPILNTPRLVAMHAVDELDPLGGLAPERKSVATACALLPQPAGLEAGAMASRRMAESKHDPLLETEARSTERNRAPKIE